MHRILVMLWSVLLLLWCLSCLPVLADTVPESWATLAQDGSRRMSNPTSLQGATTLLWSRVFAGFPEGDVTSDQSYQRSANLMVRDGRVALLTPSLAPESVTPYNGRFATMSLLDLRTGQTLSSQLVPHRGAGGFSVAGQRGNMDSDTPAGLVLGYWAADGTMVLAHGGDHSSTTLLDPVTGDVPFGRQAPNLSGVNGSGYFAMTTGLPGLAARGGVGSHNFYDGGEAVELPGRLPPTPVNALKMYAATLLDGPWAYASTVVNLNRSYGWGQGTLLTAYEVTGPPWTLPKRWTHTQPQITMLNQGSNHTQGALRAYAVDADHLTYVGHWTKGTGTAQLIDPTRGLALVRVPLAGTGPTREPDLTLELPIVLTEGTGSARLTTAKAAQYLVPQLALSGDYAVVFQPQQSWPPGVTLTRAHVWIVHVPSGTMRHLDWPWGAFQTNTGPSYWMSVGRQSTERAVQCVVAGEHAYLVEPWEEGGTLQLHVEQLTLATGERTPSRHLVPGVTVPAGPGRLALRDLAAVDGRLVALVDITEATQAPFDSAKTQVLAVLEGAAQGARAHRPVAVIATPSTGAGLVVTRSDVPLPPTNQVDSGSPVPYSAAGSLDPDGASLTYLWDFGDGTTSPQPVGTHVYASTGTLDSLTPRRLTLVVTDSTGLPSLPLARDLMVRTRGQQQRQVQHPLADAWVSLEEEGGTGGVKPIDRPHGEESILLLGNRYQYQQKASGPKRAYLRFERPPWQITEATLRVYVPGWSIYAGLGPYALQVHTAADGWQEATITGRLAPLPGPIIASHQVPATVGPSPKVVGVWIEIPLTAALPSVGDGPLTLALDLLHPLPVSSATYAELTLESREGAHPPELVLWGDDRAPQPPIITQQPQAQILSLACTGPVTFRVHVAGSEPMQVQWLLNGVPIPGATGLHYTKPCVSSSDVGMYGCVISNALGQAQCDGALLRVE